MINDLITNINSGKQNIILDKPKVYAISYYTIDIYNADINHPLHKFWFFIPKAKIIEKTKNYIILALSTNESDTKLVNYVEDLENKILESFKGSLFESIKKIKNSFNIEENYPPTIKLDIRGDIPIFNDRDEEIDVTNLKNNILVSIILELDNVMASTDEAWIMWKILQIKKLDNIDLRKSLFRVASDSKSISYQIPLQQSIPIPPPPPLPSLSSITPQIKPIKIENLNKNENSLAKQNNTTTRFSISETEIIDQINRLKKVKLEKLEKENNNKENMYKINELKKVETKIPLSTNQWFIESLEVETFYDIVNSNFDNEYLTKLIKLNNILSKKIKKFKHNYNEILELFDNLTN